MRKLVFFAVVSALAAVFTGVISASTPGADVKLTMTRWIRVCERVHAWDRKRLHGRDAAGVLAARAVGRTSRPVAIDPRDPAVILGSSNDYCGVYNATDASGAPIPVGPIWEGYYRSENGGASFVSSLVPGYPDDTSPYALLAKQQVRTASAGDPVIAWDAQGRAFFGSESSDDPAGTPKTFGDVWVARFVSRRRVRRRVRIPTASSTRARPSSRTGSSAPNLLGKFNDKTAIEADHNSDGRVRQQRLLLVVALQRECRRRRHLLRPLDRPRRDVLRTR